MIRIWLARDKSIPLREQLCAQLVLGILSRRLTPGERLPSVRELARRLKIHSNTVSSAYRDLAARGWVSQRRGSGVFVRGLALPISGEGAEGFVRSLIDDGLERGFSLEALESAWRKVRADVRAEAMHPKLLVVHPERDLARILAAEIAAAVGFPVASARADEAPHDLPAQTCVLVTASCEARVVNELRPARHLVIRLNSMEEVIAGKHRPSSAPLIAVISRSESILHWSSTLLPALGFPVTDILARNPDVPGWQDGLGVCDIVATDIEAAKELPANIEQTAIRIVSNDFLDEVRALVTAQKV